ncbi:MAG: energy transducer TonB [Xanthomonadales bacterium]|nr:energy transducer TonB [Xanthomonadales bacterium]
MNSRTLGTMLVAAMIGMAAPPASAQEPANAYKPERIEATAPEYPRKAYRDEVEGHVDLELTIGTDGRVEDVAILDAEPRQVFERAAIRAAMRWRYRPPSEDGITEPVKDKVRLSFKIELYR